MKALSKKDLINTYIENDNGKLLKLYMETCASVGLHVFHDGQKAFDAEFYKDGLFIACNEYSEPDSEGVLQLFMVNEDLGCELTWENLVKMNIDKVETQTEHQEEMSAFSGEVEWKNGDECVVINDNNRYSVYNEHKKHLGSIGIIRSLFKTKDGTEMAAVQAENGDCICWRLVMLSKPETPQQREDRERLEAAYELLCIGNRALSVTAPCTFDEFKLDDPQCYFWLAIVDKTNYRKVVE
ncbi:hypothetical protein NVP1124O_31 [Vibrio phage 1.124.O._10N.286.49.B1]|nr:hypothetical protein NVP1124O_31 [Vibrio phage 1.124.O._10N.286.49.B1]